MMLEKPSTGPLVETIDLKKHFPLGGGILGRDAGSVKAVDGVSLRVWPGESVGLVGESGSGKSTFAKCLLRILEPTGGEILFDGEEITDLSPAGMRSLRTQMQMIFQNPYSSLDPRMRVKTIVAEPLLIHRRGRGRAIDDRVRELLNVVGLGWELAYRLPHELSGGQRQRIAMARALALNPRFIVLDEPTSALDVSVQAQVLNLVIDLQEEFGFSYLFISHDLAVIRHVCDRVALMYLGVIVESASVKEIFDAPLHPYTQALLSANPEPDPDDDTEEIILEGDLSTVATDQGTCRFANRCFARRGDRCRDEEPALREVKEGHFVACHLY
jgi:oligopeptide/dipeptide ABC transporter ATP-binding protein